MSTTTFVTAGYHIFPPLPVPTVDTATTWVNARPDHDVMENHLICLLYCQVARKVEQLLAEGKRVTGYTSMSWTPTAVYDTRQSFKSADRKRECHSSIPDDGIGDDEVETFYAWTLQMGVVWDT